MTRWTDALKVWNSLNIHHNDREWAVPRKGTPDHEKVVKIMHDAKRGSEKHAVTRTVERKPLDDVDKAIINEILEKHSKKEEKKEEKKAPAPRKQLATKAAKKRSEPAKREGDPEAVKLHLHNEIVTLEKHLKDDTARLEGANLTPTQRKGIEKEAASMKKVATKLKNELKGDAPSNEKASELPKKAINAALERAGSYLRDKDGYPLKDDTGKPFVNYDKVYFLGKLSVDSKMSKAKLAKMFKDLPLEFDEEALEEFMKSH